MNVYRITTRNTTQKFLVIRGGKKTEQSKWDQFNKRQKQTTQK